MLSPCLLPSFFLIFFFISFIASIRSTSEPLVRSSGRPQGCWNRDTWSYKNGRRIQLFLSLLLLATCYFFSLLARVLFLSLYLSLIFYFFTLLRPHSFSFLSLNLYLYFLSLYSFTHTLSVFPLCISESLSLSVAGLVLS